MFESEIFSKFKNIKNPVSVVIDMDQNSQILFLFDVIGTILMTISMPVISKMFMSEVSADELGQRMLVSTICGFILEQFWVKSVRNGLLKHYMCFCWLETALTTGLIVYMLIFGWNYHVYMWGSVLYGTFISRIVGKLTSAYSNQLWQGRDREDRQNSLSYLNKVAGIAAGILLALGVVPTLEQSLIMWGITSAIDDLGWMIVYSRNKEQLDRDVLKEKPSKKD